MFTFVIFVNTSGKQSIDDDYLAKELNEWD